MSPKTAFVFAGGGSLGAVQVGMLKALAPAGVERIERIWLGLSRSDVFPFPFIQG